MYNRNADTFTLVFKQNAIDIVSDWTDLINSVAGTSQAIDDFVTANHTHANTVVMSGISEDPVSGNMLYNNIELGGATTEGGVAMGNNTW
jgi:hypothetical protein